MSAALLLGLLLAGLVLQSSNRVANVENVRVIHRSWTEVELVWDYGSNTEKSSQFLVEYKRDTEPPLKLVTSRKSLTLKNLRAASSYHVQMKTQVFSSGKWLESRATDISFETLKQDWSAPTHIRAEFIGRKDDHIDYNLRWSQIHPESVSHFLVQICSSSNCNLHQSRDPEILWNANFSTEYRIRISSVYRFDSNIEETRESLTFSFKTDPGVPSGVNNIHSVIVDNDIKLSWNIPKSTRGKLGGYRIVVRDFSDSAYSYNTTRSSHFETSVKCSHMYKFSLNAFNVDTNGTALYGPPTEVLIGAPECSRTAVFVLALAFVCALVLLSLIIPYRIHLRILGERARTRVASLSKKKGLIHFDDRNVNVA